jgi:hypothetical protein
VCLYAVEKSLACLSQSSGSGNLLAPVVHYYFLKWRYQSRRNPYVRLVADCWTCSSFCGMKVLQILDFSNC